MSQRKNPWKQLSQALSKASALLEQDFESFKSEGIIVNQETSAQLSPLVALGLVHEDADTFYPTQALASLESAMQGHTNRTIRSDLEEESKFLFANMRSYRNAIVRAEHDEADELFKTMQSAVGSLIIGLKEELREIGTKIEQEAGFSNSLDERIAQLGDIHDRLNRLTKKLTVFDYHQLRLEIKNDTALAPMLRQRLINPIILIQQHILLCLSKTESLSVSMRKQNRAKKRLFALAALFDQQEVDVSSLIYDDPYAGHYIAATASPAKAAPYPYAQGDIEQDTLVSFVRSLPYLKPALAHDGDDLAQLAAEKSKREPIKVQAREREKAVEPESWIAKHLNAMLQLLIASKAPLSASAYWQTHGEPGKTPSFWLYALHGFYESAIANTPKLGDLVKLQPQFADHARYCANRTIVDLILTPQKPQ